MPTVKDRIKKAKKVKVPAGNKKGYCRAMGKRLQKGLKNKLSSGHCQKKIPAN